MVQELKLRPRDDRQLLLLRTLINLRWLAIAGQTVTVVFVDRGLDFEFPVILCGAVIASSVWLNIFLTLRYPASYRPTDNAALVLLGFDIIQLSLLLYLTGGLQNPFAILLMVPVIISATSHTARRALVLGILVVAAASILSFFHEPLPWNQGVIPHTPFLYVAGTFVAIVSSLLFTAIYTFRVAEEARRLADALSATELVLQREQHLSALDGLAAAAAHELGTPLATIALVSKEMQRELGDDSPLSDDVRLLRSQADRCREIPQKLTSLPTIGEEHLSRLPLTSLIEEVVSPHRDFGIDIKVVTLGDDTAQPVSQRNPGIIYGLGNLVENAVDFAKEQVLIETSWNNDTVKIVISDDGPGFASEVFGRIGEPFVTTRGQNKDQTSGGLGLGLFIAKTLLERSQGQLKFSNRNGRTSRSSGKSSGARVEIEWPREAIDTHTKSKGSQH